MYLPIHEPEHVEIGINSEDDDCQQDNSRNRFQALHHYSGDTWQETTGYQSNLQIKCS